MKNIVIYGGSFNPPHTAHRIIAEKLAKDFDKLFIVPCGIWKPSTKTILDIHRLNMVKIAFKNVKATIDYTDLNLGIYTPTYILYEQWKNIYPNDKLWFAIGEDSIVGGQNKKSEIHRIWDYGEAIWDNLNWIVITRAGYGAKKEDLPPKSIIIEIKDIIGSGTLIRKLIKEGKSTSDLIDTEIENYIKKYKLYQEEK